MFSLCFGRQLSRRAAADRLSLVIGGLVRALPGRIGSAAMPDTLIRLVCLRIGRVGDVIQGLAAALRAGTPLARRPPVWRRAAVDAPGRASMEVPDRAPVRAAALPRGFAWLVAAMPSDAAAYASQLVAVLAEPEMAALLAASPRAVRAFRPLCRMLGVAMPMGEAMPPVAAGVRTRDAGALDIGAAEARAAVVGGADAGLRLGRIAACDERRPRARRARRRRRSMAITPSLSRIGFARRDCTPTYAVSVTTAAEGAVRPCRAALDCSRDASPRSARWVGPGIDDLVGRSGRLGRALLAACGKRKQHGRREQDRLHTPMPSCRGLDGDAFMPVPPANA